MGESITIAALDGAFRQPGGILLEDASSNTSCGAFASCHTFFSSQRDGEQGYGMWLHETLILHVVKPLEAFVRYQFSFNVTNPSYSQNAPPIVAAANGFNFTIRDTRFTLGIGDAAALYVSGFLVQMITQSSVSQGALNRIQISLVTNTDFSGNITVSGKIVYSLQQRTRSLLSPTNVEKTYLHATFILLLICSHTKHTHTHTGLLGSSTSSKTLTVSSDSNKFGNMAAWSQTSGTLLVTANGLLENFTYSFSFDLVNPMSGQVSPTIQVLGEGSALIPTTNMTKGGLNAAPLLVAGFIEAHISQSTASQFTLNTITVQARCVPGFSLMQGSIVRIHNLVGSITPSSSSFEIQSAPADIFSHLGTFDSTAGTLDLPVQDTLWAQSPSSSIGFLINFTVTNGADSTCVGGGCSGQGPLIQSISMHGETNISSTPLLGVALLVADFDNLAIAQSTSAAGGLNTITLLFSTRVALLTATTVTLDGLRKFCTQEPTIDLTDAGPFQTETTFSSIPGILQMHIGSTPSIANFTYTVRFVLRNCQQPNSVANSLKISSSGVYIAPTALPASNIALVAGFLAPAEIFQQTPSAGSLNVLNISNIRANLNLPSTFITHITVTGLTGSSTQSSAHLELLTDSSSAGIFSSSADWNQESGRLVVALQSGVTIVAGQAYSFRFTLRNSLESQPSPIVIIASNELGQYELIKGRGNQAPLLIAGFITKDIGQFIAHRKTLNTLTVSLSTNCLLPMSSRISFDLGTTLESLTVSAVAGGLASSDLSMETQGSSLHVTLQKPLQPLQLYIWAFNLTNPETEQTAPTVTMCSNTVTPCSICPTITCTTMRQAPGAQAALQIHNFFPVFRADCNDLTSGWSSISMQSPSFGPRRGFGMVSINGVPLLNGSGLMLEEGIWDAANGEASFKVAAGKTIQAGTLFTLSFAVTNPLSGVLAHSVSLEARGSFPAIPWSAPNTSLEIKSGWRELKMAQSSFYPGANNTLSLTLAANIDIVSPCDLTLTGLTGSDTPDTASLAIQTDVGASSVFASSATWDKGAGTLQVSLMPGAQLLASSTSSFFFLLQNGVAAQAARAVSINVPSSCTLVSLPAQEVEVPDILLPIPGAQLGAADAAPLKIVASSFVVKSMGQSTNFPGAINTLVVTFAVSAEMSAVQKLEVSGLASASVSSSNVSLALVQNVQGLLKPRATMSAGVLSIETEPQATLIPTQVHIFSFDVYNPSTNQQSPDISILATNGVQTLAEPVDKAAGDAAPLQVSAPGFRVARISQTKCIAAAMSIITATIGLNVPLDPSVHTNLVLSGLVGTQTPSGTYPLNITGNGASAATCFGSAVVFDQVAGVLTVNTTNRHGCNSTTPLSAGTTFAVNFPVTNPATSGSAVVVTVSVGGVGSTTLENDITTILSNVLGALPGHAAPLQICAGWALAKITQSSFYPDSNNTITISLISFSRLSGGTGVTVTGLLGAQTQSSSNFTVIAGGSSSAIWRAAQWDQDTGSISLSIGAGQFLQENTLYLIMFTLLNPGKEQSSQSTSIFSTEASSVMGAAVAMQTESDLILPIPGAVAGDAAPMLVKARGFSLKTLGQSNPFPGARNTLRLSIAINSLQPFGSMPVTKILIQGLYGPRADAPTFIPITQAGASGPIFEGTAQWQGRSNSSYGGSLLTLTVVSTKSVAVGQIYQVALDFLNPWAGQSAANHVTIIAMVQSHATGTHVVGYSEAISQDDQTVLAFPGARPGDARPFHILTAGFTMATVSQSAPYGNYSHNIITITFATSANLTAEDGSHITVHGLVGNEMSDSQRLVVAGGFVDPYTSSQPAISADTDFSAGLLNDVWTSNENGSHWKHLNRSQPWVKREGHSLVFHAGGSRLSPDLSSSALFLMGGRTIILGRNRSRASSA